MTTMQNAQPNAAPEDGNAADVKPGDPTAKDLWAFAAKKQSKGRCIAE